MDKYNPGVTNLKKQELVSLVNLAGAYLQAKKVRDLIRSEIRQYNREIEHLQDRVAAVQGQLGETLAAIAGLEPGVNESQGQLRVAEAAMRLLEQEVAGIEAFQNDVAGKRELLPGLRLQVVQLQEEMQQQAHRLEAVQASYQQALVRQQEIEAEVASLETRLSQLQQEVPIMQNTRDILVGQMPEHFDPQVFQELQGDQAMNFESYVSEVQAKVAVLKEEIAFFQQQIAEEGQLRESLTEREQELRQALTELSGYAELADTRESMAQEVAALEEEQVRLNHALESHRVDVQGLESDLSGLDAAIDREHRQEQALSERLAYLEARAQEFDSMDNFEAELDKLRRQARRLEIAQEVDSSFYGMMNSIRVEIEVMNTSLREVAIDYQTIFAKLAEAKRGLEEA